MTLDIHLDLRHVGDFQPLRATYDETLHDVTTIIIETCMAIRNAGGGVFRFSYLGERWPVQLAPELAILLEQIPSLLPALRHTDGSCEIEFYEQGLSRTLRISGTGEQLRVECESMDAWQPPKTDGSIGRTELVRMLTNVRDEFMRFLEVRAPSTASHPWLVQWLADSESFQSTHSHS